MPITFLDEEEDIDLPVTPTKRKITFLDEEDDQTQLQSMRDRFAPQPLITQKEKQEIGTIEGITNAAKNAFDSSRQAMDVVGGVSPEEAQNIAKIEFNKKSRKLAPGYDEYQKAEGMDAVWAFAKNPIEVTSNIIAEGLAGSLPALGAGLAAGGVGAAIGAPTGIGAPIGFTAGQIAGTFAGSLATEYGSKVLEELQGEGMDISDPNSIQTFFGNEELMGKVRNKALTRGVPVAAFDAISAGIGGKLGRVFGTKAITEGGKIIGKQFATKTGEAATELGAQALAGGIGEASGSLAIGEPIEGKAVFGEVIGEVGPGSVEILTGRIADKRAMAKAQEDAKIKAAADLSTTLEENSSPLTASVVTAKSATNIEQDKLAAQLDEELSLTAVKPSVAAPVSIPTKDDYVARYSAIAQTAPEELTRAEQAFTNELATSDTREKRVNAQNALDAIKEVKGVGLTPATQAVSPVTQEGQVDSTIFDLQSVANNTATREQISSLSLSGLVDIRKGQAIINEDGEGILAQAQAPLPTLTPEARAAEVEATTPVTPAQSINEPLSFTDIEFNDNPEYDSNTGKTTRSSGIAQIVSMADRQIALVNINGVAVPFYLSTGKAGKKNVAAGKWYPILGLDVDGWINKGSQQEISSYYGSPVLRNIAEKLDNQLGTTTPARKVSSKAIVDSINKGITSIGIVPVSNGTSTTGQSISDNAKRLVDFVEGSNKQQATPVAEVSPNVAAAKPQVQITNIDSIINQGGGTLAVQENGRDVNFKQFGIVIDGDSAEVAFVEIDPSEYGRGIGLEAYRYLGNELASRGITLRSSGAQYGPGKNLWLKLAQQGNARINGTRRFEFVQSTPVTPRPLPTDVLPTETPGAEYGREGELFDVFGGVRRRPVTIEEPTIGEIPQTSPMIGEQPAEPIISEKPTTSDIVGAETATIVEQEQVVPAGKTYAQLENEALDIQSKINEEAGVSALIGVSDDSITLSGLESQEKGKGTRALEIITQEADKNNTPVSLKAESKTGETQRLKSFYMRFGFVNDPSFSPESNRMIRYPNAVPAITPTPVAETPAVTETPAAEVATATQVEQEIEVGDEASVDLAGRNETVTIARIEDINGVPTAYFDYFGYKSRPLSEMQLAKKSKQNIAKAKAKEKVSQIEIEKPKPEDFFSNEEIASLASGKAPDGWKSNPNGRDGFFLTDKKGKRWTFEPQRTNGKIASILMRAEGQYTGVTIESTPTPAVSETITPAAEPAGISEEVAPTPSPKEISAIETPTTTNLRNKIKEAKGKDRQIVVMQAMADESFFSSAIEAAEFGKPFPSIGDTRVDDRLPDSIPETIDTSKIKLSPIKAKPPETAASPMISYDDNRWVLGGVYLDSTNNMVVATDGRALVAIPQKVTGGDKIVAERNIKKQGIKKGDLIEGNYPNWKQVVPTYGKDIQKVDIDIDDALKASTILDSINNTFNNKVGSSLIVFNDAKFDPKYILSLITALVESGAKSITAQIKSEADPLLLTGSNGAIAVVMPKRATGRITHTLKARSEIKMGATSKKVEKYDTQTLLNAAKPFSEYGANYNRNIAASYERLKSSIEKGSLESTIAYNAEELQIRLNKFEPKALANAMQEQIAPAAEPKGISVGNRVKYDNSPQTYTVEEVIPQTKEEVERDEQSYSIKNEMTGEVQVVGEMGLKKVGGKRARKMAAEVIPNQEIVTPIPEANRYTFEEAVKAVDAHFGKQGIPEGVVIVNNTTEPDLEMKAGYFVNRGQIVINLAYIAKGENLGDIIDHELGHYIFGDPEFQDNFKSFWEAMTPEEQAEADRLINQFYNKETGAVQMEEKQVRAFLQLIQDSKAMPRWKQLLDSIKRWINEKLGTNFQVTDEGALAVLAAAHKRFKSGEQIIREIDSGVLKTAETAQDTEYLAAVERGDMETAQRMVNEAASKNPLLELALSASATDINAFNSDEEYISYWEKLSPEAFEETDREKLNIANDVADNAYGNFLEDAKKLGATSDEFIQLVQDATYKQNDFSPSKKDAKLNVIPLSQRFRATSPDIRRMAAEPRREQVGGMNIGKAITTPLGITKMTQNVIKAKFFDSSTISDENTSKAFGYIQQLLDKKDNSGNKLAGFVNNIVDDELIAQTQAMVDSGKFTRKEVDFEKRMGASLLRVELMNYASRLAAQGNVKMFRLLRKKINNIPSDEYDSGLSAGARSLNTAKGYDISGYNTFKIEQESNVDRLAAALFGVSKPNEEQRNIAQQALEDSEDVEYDSAEDIALDIETIEKRTGRKIIKKIEGNIEESTEPKKEELLISFQNLNADKKIKGITLTYSPKKVNPSKNIKDFIIGKLVDYRKTLINQGASGLESTFWQTMSDQERKPGPLGEIDQAQNNELAKIVQKTLIDLGLKGEPPDTKMTDIEKVASILNKQKLSEEKRIEADQRIVNEIERRRESELASGSTPEAVNAKYDTILDAWNQSMSRQLNMPVSDNMLQRLINAELKEQNTKINNLIEEADGRVVAETKQGIVDSIIRKIYGVSKESETGIEMDENYDGLKSYLEQTLDNMYALQVEKKNAAYADRQAKISLRNNVEGQAQSIIDQLANQLSDTPAFPEKQENQVKAIVQQDLRQRPDMKRKQPWTSQLAAKLIQAGASEAQAETISDLVWRQHEIKTMDRELKELQTAAEKGSLAVIIQRIKDTPLEEQQKPEWMQSVIREYLIEAGLSSQAADTAARLYESVIAERFAEAKQKAFEDTLAKSAPWKNYLSRNAQLGKNALKRIQDAIRTGVLDPTQTTEGIIAKESGWSGFSKEQLTRIVQLDGVLSDDVNNQVDKAEAMSELNKIIVKAKMPVRFRDAISAYYVAQALLGIPTFTVNIYSPTMFAIRNFAIDVAKYATTDPKMVPVAFQSFINSFKSLYDNSMYAFKNQIYMSGEIEYMQGQNILSELFDKGKAQWAKGDYANGMGNMLVGASQITGRILSSLDQGAIEMMQSQNITRYAIEAMSGNKKIPKDKRNEIVNIAITGRRKIKEDLIASGMASDRAGVLADLKVRSELMLSLSGFGIKEKDVLDAALNDALQTVGRNRAITINSLKQETKNLRDSGILSGIPIGFLEGVAQWANKGNQSQQVFAKMLYGFALVPARVFSTSLWFSPIGFVRLGVDAALKKQGIESRYAVSLATEFQQKQRFIEAIAGTVFWVGLGALVSASVGDEDDDKWFKIVVTGNGPDYNTDRQYHDSWHKKYKPHTSHIVMGKTVIPINIGRGGEAISIPLIFLGAGDDARIKEKLNQAKKSPADLEAAAEMIGSVFYSFSNRGPFSAFTKPLFDAKKQDKLASELFSQAGYFGKTFIPIVGTSLARNISDFINDPIDKSSVQGAIYSNMPIVGPMIGTKALNAFGQPIRADDWGDRLFKLGAPLAMSFPKNTPENELNELVLKKGDGPPIPTRTNAQKKFEDPLTDKEFEIYVREYGRVVSDKMFKNRKRLESMEAKNYTKELDKYVNGYSIDGTTIPGASDMAVRAIKRSRGE